MIYLLATNNPGKAKEIRPLFESAGLNLITLADLGLYFEAGEDGDSFFDNAMQKARETAGFLRGQEVLGNFPDIIAKAKQTLGQAQDDKRECSNNYIEQLAVLADDSGLVIDALDGAPGVDSTLFMGKDTPYPIRCQAIADKLALIPEKDRTARFICTLVCLMPDESFLTAEGTVEGCITREMHGSGGFGYDPIFLYPPKGKTIAQLSSSEKNQISHRGQAIQKMIGLILNANTSH